MSLQCIRANDVMTVKRLRHYWPLPVSGGFPSQRIRIARCAVRPCEYSKKGADQRKHQSSASSAFVWEASDTENVSILWRHHVFVQEEYESANASVYMCSLAEFRAPFDNPTSPVIKVGLRLLSITDHTMPVTTYGTYEEYLTSEYKTPIMNYMMSRVCV